jgi:molybdopterin converting factor small subunit
MASTVTISVKLFATLKKYLPPGSENGVQLTLPAEATVQDAIDALKIPREHAGMLVAGDTYVEANTPLTDGLQLNIFPPLAGGVRS